MATGSKGYFGEKDIKPSFYNASKERQANRARKALSDHERNTVVRPKIRTELSESPSALKSFYRQEQQNLSLKTDKKKKKRGPIAALLVALFGGSFVLLGSTSLLGPHIEALFTEATDTQYTSYSMRNTRLVKYMLDGGDQIKTRWNGAKKYTTFTPYLKKRLEKQGIKVGSINESGEFVEGNILAGKNRVLQYDGKTITANEFSKTYAENPSFRESYTKAKRGRVAGFFDDAAESIYKKLGLSRDIFRDFKHTGDAEEDTKNFRKTMSEQFDGEKDTKINTAKDETKTDEDGKTHTERVKNGEDAKVGEISNSEAQTKARSYVNSVTQKAATGANIGCAALKVASMISIAVAANETYQAIHFYMHPMENQSKTKAGNGSEAALNETLNFLTTSSTAKTTNAKTGEEYETTGTPLEAEGAKLVLGGVTPSKSKAADYSLERVSNTAMAAITTSGMAIAGCSVAQAANALVSIASIAAPGAGLVKVAMGFVIDTVVAVSAQLAIVGVLSAAIPAIAQALFTNRFEAATGIPAGELFAEGAAESNTRVARSGSGQMPTSKERAISYNRETQKVLALDAEIQRSNSGQLDPTNPNTFFGQLFSKFLAVKSHTNFTSAASTIANISAKSLASINNAYADGENTSYMTTFGNDCNRLESIGAAGTIYCGIITTTDMSTIDIAPDDETYQKVIDKNIKYKDDGTEEIIEDSNLAKFISFCADRESPFGVDDVNIRNAFELSLGTVGDSMPILGDILDIVNVAKTAESEPWATGRICVNSKENEHWDNEMKYYQRYMEDNRILNQLGSFDDNKDPVAAYRENYEKNNPLDNSDAGYLARISGLSKNDAKIVLAIAEYQDFLNNYDPSIARNFNNTEQKNSTYNFNKSDSSLNNLLLATIDPFKYLNIKDRKLQGAALC